MSNEFFETNQAKLDELWQEVKAEWDKKVAESGKSDAMFMATDMTGWVADFLTNFQLAKECLELEGFSFPPLIDGMTITVSECDD
jgi:hypothetical protein